jgi:pimeloyl-ACP methyl ester carboxylesterase
MLKKLFLIGGVILILFIAGAGLYVYTAVSPLPLGTNEIIDQVLEADLPQLVTGRSGYAQSGEIWYEMLEPEGEPKGVILLIMGIGGDGLSWPPAFLQSLVDAGYQVIRYDQRGTGMSDWVEDWQSENPYTLHDMAGDAVAILDDLGIERAHLVGISMGGMTAQQIAIDHPERVLTLATIMSSCDIVDPQLPPVSLDVVKTMTLASLKYGLIGDERNTIKQVIAARQALMGDTPYDLDTKNIAEQVLYNLRKRRGYNSQASAQHNAAVLAAESRYNALRELDIPTLVLHGRSDPFIPYEHGLKCARIIPGAQAVWVEGMGHDIPAAYNEVVVDSILANLQRAGDR